jgi:hypothetical protein
LFGFFYSRQNNFSAIRRLSPYLWQGCKFRPMLSLIAFSSKGSFSCETGPRFWRSYPKDRHSRPTVGFEPGTQGSSDLCASALTTTPVGRLILHGKRSSPSVYPPRALQKNRSLKRKLQVHYWWWRAAKFLACAWHSGFFSRGDL